MILSHLSLALAMVASLPQSEGDAEVKSAIEAQYARFAKAALKDDVETMLAILAPDYTLKPYEGKEIGRKEYEEKLIKRKNSGIPPTQYTTKMKSIQVRGGAAEVASLEIYRSDTEDATGRPAILLHTHEYRDSWVRSGDRWLLRKTVTVRETTELQKSSSLPLEASGCRIIET